MGRKIVGILTCTLLLTIALFQPRLAGELMKTGAEDDHQSIVDEGSLAITLSAKPYTITHLDSGFSEVSMVDYGTLLVAGKPMLPIKTFFVGLPPGCEVMSVGLVGEDDVEVPGLYHIRPAPPAAGNDATPIEWKTDEEVYSSSAPYPPVIYEFLGMSQMRKYSLAMIRFCPVSYSPAREKLLLHKSITLSVHYQKVNVVSDDVLADTVMDDMASAIIVNYPSIASSYRRVISPVGRQTGPDYVIITTQPLVNSFFGFINWKTSLGHYAAYFTVPWIVTNYPASDTQKSIRNFLAANYISWGIKYVLLGGSIATVPMRTCYPDPTNHSIDVPTDYYYADLTGNWDSDGDGYYGEQGQDAVDFTPEVWVGRIPIDVPSTVTNICTKIINFESSPFSGWKKNAMLLGAVYNYANEDRTGWPRWDGAELMERCRTDLLTGFSCVTMYEKEGLSPCSYSCTTLLKWSQVIQFWGGNSGWGIVNWAAHGSSTSASRKVWSTDDGDGVPESAEMTWPVFIQNTDNTQLNDQKPPIVFSASCSNEYPEVAANLGANLLVQGASAFIGATRTAYGTIGWTQPSQGGDETMSYDFIDRIANHGQDCGPALYQAKQYVYNNYPWNSWMDYANMYDFNLYGDPSMVMNFPPSTPRLPSGPTQGVSTIDYTYTTNATDHNSDQLYYWFEWGDGTSSGWTGPYQFGRDRECHAQLEWRRNVSNQGESQRHIRPRGELVGFAECPGCWPQDNPAHRIDRLEESDWKVDYLHGGVPHHDPVNAHPSSFW